MPGDLGTLSSAAQWANCLIRPGQVLLWSGDDQRGAYYAWRLPEAWRGLMTFAWPIPGHEIGLPHKPEVYLASAVIPMGWLSAVSLLQHLHRRLGLESPPVGAGLPRKDEMRRDRPTLVSATTENGGWLSYYLDDFDCPELVPETCWRSLKGVLSPVHAQQRAAYTRAGVKISEEKAHVRELHVERMGAQIDGLSGFLSVPFEKLLETGWFFIWSLRLQAVRPKVMMMILGRLVRCFEFRRPLMSWLNHSWPSSILSSAKPYSARVFTELLNAISMLPLACCDLRTPVNGLVTCSDASTKGGGLCASSGLTEAGENMLAWLDHKGQDPDSVGFRRLGSMMQTHVKTKIRGCGSWL